MRFKYDSNMKAMCINETTREFERKDVSDPVCHDEFGVKIKVKACAVKIAAKSC